MAKTKYCRFCGAKLGILNRVKVESEFVCINCYNKGLKSGIGLPLTIRHLEEITKEEYEIKMGIKQRREQEEKNREKEKERVKIASLPEEEELEIKLVANKEKRVQNAIERHEVGEHAEISQELEEIDEWDFEEYFLVKTGRDYIGQIPSRYEDKIKLLAKHYSSEITISKIKWDKEKEVNEIYIKITAQISK